MNNGYVKKLVIKTLSKYQIGVVDAHSIKSMIAGEGYTIIRFSSLKTSDETTRLLNALYLDDRSEYNDSFTYNDRERRIVFIRKDISDDEFLYLLALELGRIITFRTECDGVIGISAEDDMNAHEFAYHMCDLSKHGIVYNFFKTYSVPSVVTAVSALICLSFISCFFIIKGCSSDPEIAENQNSVVSDMAMSVDVEETSTSDISGIIVSTDKINVEDGYYYATKSGKKYHVKDCGYISGKDIKQVYDEDIASGKYTPCTKCIK